MYARNTVYRKPTCGQPHEVVFGITSHRKPLEVVDTCFFNSSFLETPRQDCLPDLVSINYITYFLGMGNNVLFLKKPI